MCIKIPLQCDRGIFDSRKCSHHQTFPWCFRGNGTICFYERIFRNRICKEICRKSEKTIDRIIIVIIMRASNGQKIFLLPKYQTIIPQILSDTVKKESRHGKNLGTTRWDRFFVSTSDIWSRDKKFQTADIGTSAYIRNGVACNRRSARHQAWSIRQSVYFR